MVGTTHYKVTPDLPASSPKASVKARLAARATQGPFLAPGSAALACLWAQSGQPLRERLQSPPCQQGSRAQLSGPRCPGLDGAWFLFPGTAAGLGTGVSQGSDVYDNPV